MAVGYGARRRAVVKNFSQTLPQFGPVYEPVKLRELVRILEAPLIESSSQRVVPTSVSIDLPLTADVVLANAASGPVTITLPDARDSGDRLVTIKRLNSGANAVTVATSFNQAIDGSSTFVLTTQYNSVTVVSDNQNWHITGR